MKGTVKFYDFKKEFGFISGEDGKDYFVHRTGIKPGIRLKDFSSVEFDAEKGDRGLRAVNVRLTD